MPYDIHQWDDIAGDFERGTALIGNGASMAVDASFGYGALLQEARRLGLFTAEVEELVQY